MAGYQSILLDKDPGQGIARLTLNRPQRRNSLDDPMQEELCHALADVAADDAMRVLVIGGAGASFCAGADLETLRGGSQPGGWAQGSADDIRRSFRRAQRIILGLQGMEKPVIATINGAAVGAGFDLVCACDLRIGSPRARFMVAYVRIGLFPGFGGTWLYPRALGSIGKAAEMLFTGEFLEAEEAHRLGFLNKLVPEADLERVTLETARKIASGPPIAIRLSKLMLYRGLEFDLETAMKMAAAAETITLTSQDHEEGMAAMRESRKPVYEGR